LLSISEIILLKGIERALKYYHDRYPNVFI